MENIFVGQPIPKNDSINMSKNKMSNDYMISNLVLENTTLKENLDKEIQKNLQLEALINEKERYISNVTTAERSQLESAKEIFNLKSVNEELEKRVDYFQKRERDLLETLLKIKNSN